MGAVRPQAEHRVVRGADRRDRHPPARAPNHLKRDEACCPGERTLKDGTSDLTIAFRGRPEQGRRPKLVKDPTRSTAGQIRDRTSTHELAQRRQCAPWRSPQLYLQFAARLRKPWAANSFYSTFTGPAVYNDQVEVPQDRVQGHRQGQHQFRPRPQTAAGIAMGGSTTSPRPGSANEAPARANLRPRARSIRASPAFKPPHVRDCRGLHLAVDCARAPSQSFKSVLFCRPARKEGQAQDHHPRPSRLVKDYGVFKIIAEGRLFWAAHAAAQDTGQLGLGDRRASWVLLKIAFYWLQREGLLVDGEDEGHQPQGHGVCASA